MNEKLAIAFTENTDYKSHHKTGRELLAKICAENFGKMPDISVSSAGRPFFTAISAWDFNISHSKHLVVCSFANGRTGCDIQYTGRCTNLKYVKKFFHQDEISEFESIDNIDEKKNMYYQLWTLKEAYLKLYGKSVMQIKDTPAFIIRNSKIEVIYQNPNENLFFLTFKASDYFLSTVFIAKPDIEKLFAGLQGANIPEFALIAKSE